MFTWIQQVDESILLTIAGWHNPVLDFIMPVITTLGTGGMIWIALTAVLLIPRKTRKYAVIMGVSLGLAALIGNLIIKPIVARERPFTVLTELPEILGRPDGYSFPSGHTISSFATATVLWFCSWKLALPATCMAALIGFSRCYLFCHYPSDVVFGALFGIVIALLMVLVYHLTLGRKYPLREPAPSLRTMFRGRHGT